MDNSLKIELVATRSPTADPQALLLAFLFSNKTALPITELHFQLAVAKGYEAELKPQSGRVLEPGQSKGVTQHSRVWHAGDRSRRVEGVKIRWRVSYRVGGEARSETGEVPEFGVA